MVDASLAHITHYKTPGAQSCVETLAKGGRQFMKYGGNPRQCYFIQHLDPNLRGKNKLLE